MIIHDSKWRNDYGRGFEKGGEWRTLCVNGRRGFNKNIKTDSKDTIRSFLKQLYDFRSNHGQNRFHNIEKILGVVQERRNEILGKKIIMSRK